MANPQKEDGNTEIANEIVEVLAKTYLSSYESQILWSIFRKTYGWHKKEDWITGSQLVEMTGIAKGHISRTLKKLTDRNMINKNGKKLSFQKDYDKWVKLPKQVTGGDWRNEDNWKSNPLKNIKQKILIRDSKECILCGNKKNLCIHHIDYNEENWEENNLITLCNSCHPKTNSKNQEQWINFFNNIFVTQMGNNKEVTQMGQEVTQMGQEVTQMGQEVTQMGKHKRNYTKETSSKEIIQKKTLSQTSFNKFGKVYQLTIYLEGKIMENNGAVNKRNESQIQSWCKDMDKLIRIDKAKPEEIKQVIDWVVKDDFWNTNVMSAEKLRKHYSKLYKKAIDKGKSLKQVAEEDPFDWGKAIGEGENINDKEGND